MATSSSDGSGRKGDEVHQLSKTYWREQREISPDGRRTILWSEPHDNATSCKRVPVLYYLCRNGQLQHPHFMEVPLSSPQGLFLTDVISRLNVLRGKAMASLYSWSCKRSYKNGFVWHDLSENDFIYPAHGHEYVLKGSELPVKALLDAGSSSPPPPPAETQGSGADDLDSLQAADSRRRNHSCLGNKQQQRDECEIEISPPLSDSSPETLETLMKADGRPTVSAAKANENPPATNTHQDHPDIQRCRSSVLMQLISCGSMPFKDCGAGQVQVQGLMGQYKMRVARGGGSAESGRGKVEYLSGSLVEKKEEEFPSLNRSTSYTADGRPHLEVGEKEIEGVRTKCIPRKPKSQSSSTTARKGGVVVTDLS
ncbi:LOW QUALITY PROTEIN: protein UPSTREAM OF FLC [Sesamum indicum]|uniref:LOW QUALITY PROTEIN: protein UPSTREAM OF FLC n=1 Tax=Sesamum indicum TaxID=4182 RepID=A0A6I9TWI7_SESIN|nr:LOW QUALITY PROTEIN: protein UPSTREAM OF FLC [Sesamum indicum]